jgi:Mg2+ and Co2+ transporter CorA
MNDIPETGTAQTPAAEKQHLTPGDMKSPIAFVVDTSGIWPWDTAANDRTVDSKFRWIDIFAGEDNQRNDLLRHLAFQDADAAWALRFGQVGRMGIDRNRLRAVTWLADSAGQLIELHLICTKGHIVTVWNGDPAGLEDVRQHFAERIAGVENTPYQAAGMLLQLILGTLDHTIHDLDAQLEGLRLSIDQGGAMDLAPLIAHWQRLQFAWVNFDRYSSSVRAAVVGIEAVAGVGPRGADELNDYADRVEDIEEKLIERRRWLSEIIHDSATAIAQRQGEQINRLTLVSLIFLPVTAVTGFFGMNFNWMIDALGSERAFFALGVILPTVMVLATVSWLGYRGLIQFIRRPPAHRPAGTTEPPRSRQGPPR